MAVALVAAWFSLLLGGDSWCDEPATGIPIDQANDLNYTRDIKPILKSHCYACHGASKQEAGLRLDTGALIRQGGDNGPGLVVGNPVKSSIIQRITADEVDRMPPEGAPLAADQIELLKVWIERGAASPVDEERQVHPRDHWAFQVPVQPRGPDVRNPAWIRNAIDAFVLARLDAEQIEPSPPADRSVLLRRIYLDLSGLAPTRDEVDAFLEDHQAGAYDRLVDRLLASPAFGERWGRHWLDLARYADSNGYEDDRHRPDAWRFRDWVIDAYNADMPFDRFTIEQLAGDLLDDATYEQRLATGFHRMTLSNDGGADSVEEEFRIVAVKDRVNTTGSVWLGLSVGCAQCHAHKYDPISHQEYYQLFAFFNDAEDTSIPAPPLVARYTSAYEEELRKFQFRNSEVYAALEEYEKEQLPPVQAIWEKTASNDDRRRAAKVLETRPPRRSVSDQITLASMFVKLDRKYGVLSEQFRVARESGNNRPQPPSTKALTLTTKLRKSHVHNRGSFLDLGEEVRPTTPEFLPPLKTRGVATDRLDLARWIVDPQHPLASRVAVNHLWRQLFGRGLVATPDNFGLTGSPPSHPQLLDWLATEFVCQGWSTKAVIKMIVTSSTYRQSSRRRLELADIDPENVLLARQTRGRVEAETVRDLALDAAGLLNRQVGGPSFQPPLPSGLSQLVELKNEQLMEPTAGSDRYRRGVYVNVQRMFMLPMLKTFDAADPNISCSRRDRSNTPLQALTLLNDPVFFEAARALGQQIVIAGQGGTRERIRFAFQRCLVRDPEEYELVTLDRLFLRQIDLCEQQPELANELIGGTQFPAGVRPAEAAAWIGVARTILNLDEFITRE